jgi:hypothetical protein
MKKLVLACLVFCLAAPFSDAQTGGNSVVDGRLGQLGSSLAYQGRTGTYPAGNIRFSMATTSCNPGAVNLPWLQASNVTHPFIGFLAARLEPGATRLVQISDRSWIKHGFFALSNNQCSTCQCPSGGQFLGIACSDTYSTGNNASALAPADDINPWTGVWTPGSQPNGGTSNTLKILDTEATVAGASYYYCAHYVFPSWTQNSIGASCTSGGSPIPQPAGSPLGFLCEPDANRNNNWASRQMTISISPTTGSATLASTGLQLDGTVLQRWTGATINSNTNGNPVTGPSDGRVYVAVKVTGPVNGKYHYEYALHNRDNKGGVGTFRVPSCPSAVVSNVGFHDIDVPANAANNWTFANNGSELVWTAPAGNSLRWNMLFNFWFDSDAAPTTDNVTLDQAVLVGGVNPSFTVASSVPTGLYNVNLGPGCSATTPPSLYATGVPARASLNNATFALQSSGNGPGNTVYLYFSLVSGTFSDYAPCFVYLGPDLSSAMEIASVTATGSGLATFPIPIPNDPMLEGAAADCQAIELANGGALFGTVNLSNGLRVRAGDLITGCP